MKHLYRFSSYFLLLSLLLLRSLIVPSLVSADTSCTMSLSPNTVIVGQSRNLTLTVTNTGTNPIVLLYLYRPDAGYSITGGTKDGWTSDLSDDSRLSFNNGTIEVGQSQDFMIAITADSSPVDMTSLNVQATELADGNGLIDCGTGTFAVTASTAPVISNITISDVNDTSAKINWTTDKNGTSSLSYGTSTSYGSSKSDSTSSTAHSLSISSLSADTTYHAIVSSTDGDGYTGSSSDFTFATAKTGSTTTTVTVTNTVTNTTTRTVTATPIPDTTPPVLQIQTDFKKVFTLAPEISGKTSDEKGISSIQYSIDSGHHWFPVESDFVPGAKEVKFSFVPAGLFDGKYELKLKAKDTNGNEKISKAQVFVIDRLPPRFGGAIFTAGSQIITPDNNGVIQLPRNQHLRVFLSAVGGPETATLSAGLTVHPMVYSRDQKLWVGDIQTNGTEPMQLTSTTTDGANNHTEQDMGRIELIENGKIFGKDQKPLSGAKLSVYFLHPDLLTYVLWDGRPFGQTNPQQSDASGEYSLRLPGGTYYLALDAPGYRTQRSEIFTLDGPQFIDQNFSLEVSRQMHWGPFTLSVPQLFDRPVSMKVHEISPYQDSIYKLNTEFPFFRLHTLTDEITSDDLIGKATVISFVSNWMPETRTQLNVLNELYLQNVFNVYAVLFQNTRSEVEVFSKRNAINMPFIIDSDGVMMNVRKIVTLPTHYFLDKHGVIKAVRTGILTKDDFLNELMK